MIVWQKNCSLTIALSFLFLTSCAPVNQKVATHPKVINPKSKPVINVTSFSEGLSCMDTLMAAELDMNILIIAEDIPNKSGIKGLAESGKEMLISTISTMASKSGRLRFVSIDAELPIINQLFTAYQKNKPSKQFKLPDYFIRGAISQVEKGASRAGKDISAEVAGIVAGGVGKTKSMSVIALDMNIGELGTMQIVPGVTSHNVIAVFNKDEAMDIMGGYIGFGNLGYSMEFNESEGMSAAMRNLIELGSIELVGKLLNLPYQQCIDPNSRPIVIAEANKKIRTKTIARRQQQEGNPNVQLRSEPAVKQQQTVLAQKKQEPKQIQKMPVSEPTSVATEQEITENPKMEQRKTLEYSPERSRQSFVVGEQEFDSDTETVISY